MTGDSGVPEVATDLCHIDGVEALILLIRDLDHRAALLDDLIRSARDPEFDRDRALVDVDAGLWRSAATAVLTPRLALPAART